jgi:hypothetical protein
LRAARLADGERGELPDAIANKSRRVGLDSSQMLFHRPFTLAVVVALRDRRGLAVDFYLKRVALLRGRNAAALSWRKRFLQVKSRALARS